MNILKNAYVLSSLTPLPLPRPGGRGGDNSGFSLVPMRKQGFRKTPLNAYIAMEKYPLNAYIIKNTPNYAF